MRDKIQQNEIDNHKTYFTHIDQHYEGFSNAFEESVKDGSVLMSFKSGNHIDLFLNRYELAHAIDNIEGMRYLTSYQMLAELFKNWVEKSKDESKTKTLKRCQNALIDIFYHNFNLEQNIKYVIAEKRTIQDQLSLYQKKAYELAKQNDALKKEIEFLSK